MKPYQHHDEVAQRPHRLDHDLEGVVERLPRLGQLEHPEEPERPEHGEALDPLRQELHEREDDDEKVENVPAILRGKCLTFKSVHKESNNNGSASLEVCSRSKDPRG